MQKPARKGFIALLYKGARYAGTIYAVIEQVEQNKLDKEDFKGFAFE